VGVAFGSAAPGTVELEEAVVLAAGLLVAVGRTVGVMAAPSVVGAAMTWTAMVARTAVGAGAVQAQRLGAGLGEGDADHGLTVVIGTEAMAAEVAGQPHLRRGILQQRASVAGGNQEITLVAGDRVALLVLGSDGEISRTVLIDRAWSGQNEMHCMHPEPIVHADRLGAVLQPGLHLRRPWLREGDSQVGSAAGWRDRDALTGRAGQRGSARDLGPVV